MLGTRERRTARHGLPKIRQVPPVAGGLRFESVSAGRDHTCGLTVEGRAYCWGAGSSGQLGTGTEADHLAPVEVVFQQAP